MMIALLSAMALQAAAVAPPPSAEAQRLRAVDQALLDAITDGDRALWDRTLTPDAVYVDENGAVMQRDAYLKTLIPLPAGISGQLAITDYDAKFDGDTALVIHRDDERENYHGVALHANYLMTETWLKQAGVWKLAMVHAYVVAVDPPAVNLPPAALDAYVGRYTAADGLVYVIRREGDHLVSGREGRPMQVLSAEAPDLMFTPGQPREKKLFSRDAAGKVTGFIDRREGEDIVWTRAAG